MKSILLLLLVLAYPFVYGQELKDSMIVVEVFDSATYFVHFDSDQSEITENELQKLNSYLSEFDADKKCLGIELFGHTDSDGSESYNIQLSERRIKAVKKVLGNHYGSMPIDEAAFGESNLLEKEIKASNKAANRRVKLTIHYVQLQNQMIKCGTKSIQCTDTLIELPQGTLVQLSTCDLDKIGYGIQFQESITPAAVRANNEETIDTNGDLLYSAGMFEYTFVDCPKTHKVYLPVREECFIAGMRLYSIADGRWQREGSSQLNIVTINGKRYYEMEVNCSGKINADIKAPDMSKKIVFRGKQGVQLKQVNYACDCPMSNQSVSAESGYNKKLKIARVCCDDPQVKIIAKNKNGNLVELDWEDINHLKSNPSLLGCKLVDYKKIGFLKIRKKSIYRRYRILPTHFK